MVVSLSSLFFFFLIYIYSFIWLHRVPVAAGRIFNLCGCVLEPQLQHVGFRYPTRDRTQVPCIERLESQPPDHQESPSKQHSIKATTLMLVFGEVILEGVRLHQMLHYIIFQSSQLIQKQYSQLLKLLKLKKYFDNNTCIHTHRQIK